eukprot:5867463-Pyramimonas_sp.AAC.1
MAEYLAFAFSCQAADRPTTLHADFKGTINQFKKMAQEQVMATQRHGGVFGFAQSLPGLEHIKDIRHVKAHRSVDEYASLDAETKRITDGSAAAYYDASEGAKRHAAISPEFNDKMEQHQK